jgi:hypothetical protein
MDVLVDTLVDSFTPNPDIEIYTVIDESGFKVFQTDDSCEAYGYVDKMNQLREELRSH